MGASHASPSSYCKLKKNTRHVGRWGALVVALVDALVLLVAMVSLLVTRLVAPVVVVVVVLLVALLVALVIALSCFPYKESVHKRLRAGALVVSPLLLLLVVFNVLKIPSASAPYLSY